MILLLGLLCPHVEGCTMTADPAPGRGRLLWPIAYALLDSGRAFSLSVLSAPRYPDRQKGSGQRCLHVSPCSYHALVLRLQPVFTDLQQLLIFVLGDIRTRGIWVCSVFFRSLHQAPTVPPKESLPRVFTAICCTQERPRPLAFYKRLWLEQTTYLAGVKTLMLLLKLESQEPSGPPGDSERNKVSCQRTAEVFRMNKITDIRTQTL